MNADCVASSFSPARAASASHDGGRHSGRAVTLGCADARPVDRRRTRLADALDVDCRPHEARRPRGRAGTERPSGRHARRGRAGWRCGPTTCSGYSTRSGSTQSSATADPPPRRGGGAALAALARTRPTTVPWDLVVVDCAPTAETLRLLALPEVLRLAPRQAGFRPRRLLARCCGRGRDRGDRRSRTGPRRTAWSGAVQWLDHELGGGAGPCSPRRRRAVRVGPDTGGRVVSPRPSGVHVVLLHGYRVDAVVVNRRVPGRATGRRGPLAHDVGRPRRPQGWRRLHGRSAAPVPVGTRRTSRASPSEPMRSRPRSPTTDGV